MNNAYEIPNLRFSLPAGEDIPRRRFISVNSSGEGVLATAGGSIIGVSMNEAAEGEVLEVADGIVIVETSAAINAGDSISVATDGRAVTTTNGTTTNDTTTNGTTTNGIVVGTALTSAAGANLFVTVKLL